MKKLISVALLGALYNTAQAAPSAPVAISQTKYFESCASGQTVGGIQDARTSRIAVIPIYISYDPVDSNTYYSMKQNSGGTFDVFYTVKSATGLIPYPTATKELALKYGQFQSDSVEECKPVEIVIPETLPPQFAWIEDGYEACPNGYTVGGKENGLTERHGTVEVWNTYDYYVGEIDYFKSAASGEFSQFSYSDLIGYEAPKWNVGKSIIDKFGVWDKDSNQECIKTRTFAIKQESKSENCPMNQIGLISYLRDYKLWSDGVIEPLGDWKVTSNTCETIIVTPPVITPPVVPVEPPVVVVPPVVTPDEPPIVLPPVIPEEPAFTLIEEYQTSYGICQEAQTGVKTYKELWTYELYKDGTKKNLKYVSKDLASDTCKEIKDEIIQRKDGQINESCPIGQSGTIVISGQYITYSLSGTIFEESNRQNNCVPIKENLEPEFKNENCPNGNNGYITLVRYKTTRSDGKESYPNNGAYDVFENHCESLSDEDIANSVAQTKAKGILANQSIKSSDASQIKTMIAYIKAATGDVNTYKLNVIIDNLNYDSKLLTELANIWILKTGGIVHVAGLPQGPNAFIGIGNISTENAQQTMLKSVKFNQDKGSIDIEYSQKPKGLISPRSLTASVTLFDYNTSASLANRIR
ncbi:hypothetical protein [Pseudomonas orientalis]|uniref:hypothetical protein n=1 Tax=Pseudomonas orientalis TaxID=76758 RepID=UPI0013000252|nr:hypothetical protein [Pseudomonas orientalis]